MQNYSPTSSHDIKQILDSSQEILILLRRDPVFDAVSSGLAFFLSLSSSGKRVSIACPSPMTVEFNRLVGIDKVSQSLADGGRNLIVSFPYVEGSIEKVSYNIENDVFNLVIEPREGYPTITPEKLSYSFGGGTYDCIITIGVTTLAELDSIYFQNQKLFSEKPVVNIDINPANTRFGKINTVEQNYSSYCELVTNLINVLNLRFDADIATNLLAGITYATNNFMSSSSGVSAFETAAILMRSGARRLDVGMPSAQPQPQPYQFPTQPSYQPPPPPASPSTLQSQYQQQYTQPLRQPMQQAQPTQQQTQRPQPQIRLQPQKGQIQPQSQPQQPGPNKQQKKQDQAPPDWLKPKIYKGSTLL